MRRQHELWPEPDAEAIHEQWLDNLLLDELVGHALLFAETPLERVLAKELAWITDYERPRCSACPDRSTAVDPSVG